MQPSFHEWLWEQRGKRCVENLKKNVFDAHWVRDIDVVTNLDLSMIEQCDTFGLAGSDSVRWLGLVERLTEDVNTVFDHWQPDLSLRAGLDIL